MNARLLLTVSLVVFILILAVGAFAGASKPVAQQVNADRCVSNPNTLACALR